MIKLPILLATDILHLTEEEIFDLEYELFELQFKDGNIETTKARTIWSWLLWDIHRHTAAV